MKAVAKDEKEGEDYNKEKMTENLGIKKPSKSVPLNLDRGLNQWVLQKCFVS